MPALDRRKQVPALIPEAGQAAFRVRQRAENRLAVLCFRLVAVGPRLLDPGTVTAEVEEAPAEIPQKD